MRRGLAVLLATATLAGLGLQPLHAALFSKRYQFKNGVKLELGVALPGGLRVDNVQFTIPGAGSTRARVDGPGRADVAISNDSKESRRVGIALALYDGEGRLLAVASGGSRFLPLKPDRQATYTLVFDDVNSEIHKAMTFQISIEPR